VTPARFVATLGGVGLLRPAPGTWGSLLVLPVHWLGPWWCLGLAAVLELLGFWAVRRLPNAAQDPSWVVVDEGAGQLLALAALPFTTGWLGVPLAFILFRFFDITKPGPVGWADRHHGVAGVMLDDLCAGALAGLVLLALRVWGMAL
jgi:phosphatidylglycerophosphatase A